jgi:hypothetical protein
VLHAPKVVQQASSSTAPEQHTWLLLGFLG